jgi:hypothetical protein
VYWKLIFLIVTTLSASVEKFSLYFIIYGILRKLNPTTVILQWIRHVGITETESVDSGSRRLIPASSEGHEARDTEIAAYKVGQSWKHVCRSENWRALPDLVYAFPNSVATTGNVYALIASRISLWGRAIRPCLTRHSRCVLLLTQKYKLPSF